MLYLMLGYPGAGKSTASRLIAKLTGATHLMSDAIRLEMFAQPTFSKDEHTALYNEIDRRTELLLTSGKSVIYDANLNRYQHRQEKYEICKRVGALPLLVWVQTDISIAKQRAMAVDRKHLVPPGEKPETMFERIVSILEEPLPGEPTVELSGVDITEATLKEALQL